ncbi:MAG TPA: ATP-binding protein, partial [Kofleriaceae bacterium]|nr:ATP-binding protein [Kofleriaceae bacterium]
DRLKQLGEMAAGVAHEIRNPLNGIEGFASLLTRDLPAGGKGHRYAGAIVEGVRTLNRTVTALLAFTAPKQPQRRPADPLQLAGSCIELLRAEQELRRDEGVPAAAIELVERWDGTRIAIDPDQLRQALLNLAQNAVQAAQGSGVAAPRVVITVEPHPEVAGLVISVDDNGPGVPAAERQRIFTPFYTTKDHGTGLGLAVSHTIVALHGGAITVEDAPTGGARFSVVLPVHG